MLPIWAVLVCLIFLIPCVVLIVSIMGIVRVPATVQSPMHDFQNLAMAVNFAKKLNTAQTVKMNIQHTLTLLCKLRWEKKTLTVKILTLKISQKLSYVGEVIEFRTPFVGVFCFSLLKQWSKSVRLISTQTESFSHQIIQLWSEAN